MQLSMFLSEEPPANPSRSQAFVKDWLTRGETSCWAILQLLHAIAPVGWYGRTCPVFYRQGGGRDFGSFLAGLGELGYGWAYRVLDAQYFNLAQRRQRVFVVGCLGGWRGAGAVLFERESLQGNPAPGRSAGKDFTHDLAPSIGASGRGFSRPGETRGQDPVVASTLTANGGRRRIDETYVAHALRADGFDASEDGTGRGTPLIVADTLRSHVRPGSNSVGALVFNARQDPICGDIAGPIDTDGTTQAIAFSCKDHGADAGDLSPTLRAMGHSGSHANAGGQVAVAFAQNSRDEVIEKAVMDSLKKGGGKPGQSYPAIRQGSAVRRLTPRECERLQGFPDDFTLIKYGRKMVADGPRYKAIGNSMAVPVMAWIGKRLDIVDRLLRAA